MADPNRPRTVMETDEEIRAAVIESNASGIVSRAKPPKQPPPQTEVQANEKTPTAESSLGRAFRPTPRS